MMPFWHNLGFFGVFWGFWTQNSVPFLPKKPNNFWRKSRTVFQNTFDIKTLQIANFLFGFWTEKWTKNHPKNTKKVCRDDLPESSKEFGILGFLGFWGFLCFLGLCVLAFRGFWGSKNGPFLALFWSKNHPKSGRFLVPTISKVTLGFRLFFGFAQKCETCHLNRKSRGY
jgi:hypothetical protein